MFSTCEQLAAKIGKRGTPRHEFLQDLVNEFVETSSIGGYGWKLHGLVQAKVLTFGSLMVFSAEYKEQVMANLANFAYDPINHQYLRELNVMDLFLDQLHPCTSVVNDNLREFALKGVLNLCGDEDFCRECSSAGSQLVQTCLSSPRESIVMTALAVLNEFVQLPGPSNHEFRRTVLTLPFVDALLRLKTSDDARIRTFASLILEDHCSPALISAAIAERKKFDSGAHV